MIRIVIYFQIGQTDSQQVDEKMFSITSHQGNANQNHNEILLHTCQTGKETRTNKRWQGCEEDNSHTVYSNVNRYSLCGKECGNFAKKIEIS